MQDDTRAVIGTPRFYHLGRNGSEIPLEWMIKRGAWEEDTEDRARAVAVEIAPGVSAALLGTGDFLNPDGSVTWGARIVVWVHAA